MIPRNYAPRFHLLGPLLLNGRASLLLFAGFYTLLLIVLTLLAVYPLYNHPGAYLLDPYDSLDSAWRLWWPTHALNHDPLHLFNANIFYPYLHSLMFDELLFGETLVAMPVYLLGGNAVLAVNVIVVFNFVFAGWTMCLLALQLTASRVAGVVAGILYSFSAFHFVHLGHIGISDIGWLPLIVLALDRLTRSAGDSWGSTLLLALALAMQILSAQNLAYFAVILILAYLIFALTQSTLRLRSRPHAWLAPPPTHQDLKPPQRAGHHTIRGAAPAFAFVLASRGPSRLSFAATHSFAPAFVLTASVKDCSWLILYSVNHSYASYLMRGQR